MGDLIHDTLLAAIVSPQAPKSCANVSRLTISSSAHPRAFWCGHRITERIRSAYAEGVSPLYLGEAAWVRQLPLAARGLMLLWRTVMGQPDLFAKTTFAEETERVTQGAAAWQDPPEVRLEKVQSDGMLLIRRPDLLMSLSAPWPATRPHDEIVVELKLAGDHVDRMEIETALLRRQARQVQRVKEAEDSGAPPWLGHEPLWLVAPHVPGWLSRVYAPASFAPGCYRVAPLGDWFLWIAANELPLRDELVPFLVARSGRALDEFARWVAPRRPLEWVLAMLECLAMSTSVREDLLWRFCESKDPEVEARRQRILEVLLETSPKTKQQLIEQGIDQGQLGEARVALREVLARRRLVLSPDDEARIEACGDLATLRRWLGQAATADSISEALH